MCIAAFNSRRTQSRRASRSANAHRSPQECAGRSAEPLSGPWISDRVLCRFSFLTLRGSDEDRPRGRALALRRGRQSMALQNIANRLIGNHIPEIGQGARNPVIAPVPVLARHANDQLLHLALDPRPTRAMTSLRAIEFASDQLAVPGQDSVRPGDGCDLGENLAAHAMTNFAERGSLGIRQL